MATRRFSTADPELDVLYKQLSESHLQPLWELKGLNTPEPVVRGVPYRWAGRDLRELGVLAGDLVPVDRGGDRRVLACCNPGLDGAPWAVSTLWVAVQYLRGHEVAPAHRHTPSALRFIVEGEGVFTLVDGDPIAMSPGDLVITPSWTFHEHHNPTDRPMIWMDVLDLPLVLALDAGFFEEGPSEEADTAVADRSASEAWYGGGTGLVPADGPALPARHTPLLAYRWADTERALVSLLRHTGASHARLRYTDPVRGGDVMPTMRCEIERVSPGTVTDTVRQTGGRVATVLHGTGVVRIGDEAFDVEPGDILAVPSWTPWSIEATEQVDLFSTSDAPVLDALGLFRTERLGMTTVETLVVGGGIGGLATALSIARGGRPVHLIERADAFTEIGAGLQFGPNACRALDALGVFDDLLPLAVRPDKAVMMDAVTGTPLTTLELGEGFRRRYGYPYLVLHRNDLLSLLLEHCEAHDLVTLETRRTVVDADVRPDGATVTCADGSVFRTPALVAADGLHSTLRRHVSDDRATNSGYAAYRGTMPMEQVSHAIAPEDVVLWIGPGVHLMQYKVRRGELYNQVAVFASPRFRAGHTEQGEWGGPEELDAAFAGTSAPVRAAVGHIARDRFWAMFDRAPVDRWTTGRLVLTGDAAHPMLQYLGQGACQALEDAVELGHQLQRHADDVPAAYCEFVRARMPRTARCQTSARPWGELWHTSDRLTVALRNRYFAARAANDYSEVDWLYRPADPGTAAPGLTAAPTFSAA